MRVGRGALAGVVVVASFALVACAPGANGAGKTASVVAGSGTTTGAGTITGAGTSPVTPTSSATPATTTVSASASDATGHWSGSWQETNSAGTSMAASGLGTGGSLSLDLVEDAQGNVTGVGSLDGLAGNASATLTVTQGTCDGSGQLTLTLVDSRKNTLSISGSIVLGPPDALSSDYTVTGGPFAHDAGALALER